MAVPTNEVLLRRYYQRRFGARRALDLLVRENQAWVWRVALRRTRKVELAQDLVQEVWTRVTESRGQGNAWKGTGKVAAWIQKILDLTWKDRLRKDARYRDLPPLDDASMTALIAAPEAEEWLTLERCRQRLVAEDPFGARVLILKNVAQHTWPEVIDLLEDELSDLPKAEDKRNRCRSGQRRALRSLRACMEAQPLAPPPTKERRP